MSVFKMGEFIEMAIRDEETGAAFYDALVKVTKNEDVKKGCLRMADQERMHADRFRRMLSEVGSEKPREEFAGQYEQYLDYLLTSRAFPTPEDAARKVADFKSDIDALRVAMQMEKDTLLFYDEIKALIPDTHRKYVADIILEERVHVSDIYALQKKLR